MVEGLEGTMGGGTGSFALSAGIFSAVGSKRPFFDSGSPAKKGLGITGFTMVSPSALAGVVAGALAALAGTPFIQVLST